MMCDRCNNLLQKKLYRCVDCYNDEVSDPDMCLSCKNEHDESNENKCTWREITET